MANHREFWLKITQFENIGMAGFRYSDCEVSIDPECTRNYDDFKNAIHVIEYSAYSHLESQLAEKDEYIESHRNNFQDQCELVNLQNNKIQDLELSLKEQCELNAISAERELGLEAKKAEMNKNCISLSLHESRMETVEHRLEKIKENEKLLGDLFNAKNKELADLKAENDVLMVNLNKCKDDYWFMTNLLEKYSFNKEEAIKDCIYRMNFRKPLFNILDEK